MKRFTTYLSLLGLIVIGLATTASAAGFFVASDNGTARVNVGQEIDSTAYMAGTEVLVEGIIKGDLYCAAETVTIKGVVEGDVICVGSRVDVNGAVTGDVRFAAGEVNLGGATKGNALVAASTFTTTEDFTLGGDLTAWAEKMTLKGTVIRDALIGATTLNLFTTVGRDVSAYIDTLTLSDATRISGDLWYNAPERAEIPGGSVAGETRYESSNVSQSAGNIVTAYVAFVVALIIVTVSTVLLAPRFVHVAATLETRQALLAFLIGLGLVFIIPIAAIIIMSTVVGLWVGIVMIIAWLLMIMLALVFASYYLGSTLLQGRASNALVVGAFGSLVLAVLLIIPVANILVGIVAVCAGVGMQAMHVRYQFSEKPYTIV